MDVKVPVENGTEDVPSTSSAMAKTTTISTIAVQSGATRIVIALLHVGILYIFLISDRYCQRTFFSIVRRHDVLFSCDW